MGDTWFVNLKIFLDDNGYISHWKGSMWDLTNAGEVH